MSRWPYSTTRWAKLRRRVLLEQPLCAYCHEFGITRASSVVDHAIPVRDNVDLAFMRENLIGLCGPCHNSAKQREDSRGYPTGCDALGMPRARMHDEN